MLVVSKAKNQVINVDNVDSLFVNFANDRIIAQCNDGRNIVVDDYETHQETLTAIEIIINRMIANNGEGIVCAPTDEEVKIKQRNIGMQKDRYQHGKKTKGHGGS